MLESSGAPSRGGRGETTLSYIFYGFRYFLWGIRNLLRRLRRPPDYVTFTLSGEYSEYTLPPGNLIQRRLRPSKASLQELAEQFRSVAADPRVKGVVLHLRPLEMPQPAIESLRDLLAELRASGKRIVAWASHYVPSSYLVACAADEIMLQPAGEILPLGIRRLYPFLAEALNQLGMQGDFLPISPYKSAGDMFSRKDMSDEFRAMANWLMDSAFEERLQSIAAGRRIRMERAREWVDQTPCSDARALEIGLVDRLLNEEDLPQHLGGSAKLTPGGSARLAPWDAARRALRLRPPVRPGKYVAMIAIEGTIVDGESGRPPIRPPVPVPILLDPRAGDLTVVQAARQVLRDKRAAAVVVYVNSSGGSATASEAMHSALMRVGSAKPLVVSMGPVAASGGYYVSTPGRHILAQPSTVTGSIGVLTGKIVMGDLLDRLFINRETLQRGKHTSIYDAEAPFDDQQREIIREGVTRVYDVFLERVSTGRKLSREQVDSIGGGRVWTGRQAMEHRLVDEIGGLERALAKARQMAGLGPRAPVKLVTAGKQPLAPAASPVSYALEGLGLFSSPRPLFLCPFWLHAA
ncbi:MAG: signal peptide peptidase SppA [Chloroflexota bacterium]